MITGVVRKGSGREILLPNVAQTVSAFERMRGLLGRRGLPEGEGLLVAPCNAVHTLFMRFAIDAVFLDRKGVVVKIVPCLRPFRFAMALQASSVLELKAGEAGRIGLAEGDTLVWEAEE